MEKVQRVKRLKQSDDWYELVMPSSQLKNLLEAAKDIKCPKCREVRLRQLTGFKCPDNPDVHEDVIFNWQCSRDEVEYLFASGELPHLLCDRCSARLTKLVTSDPE